jgi:hypothetical protein
MEDREEVEEEDGERMRKKGSSLRVVNDLEAR